MTVTTKQQQQSRANESGIERGSFAHGESGEVVARLVIVTYNIRYGVGSHLIGGSLFRKFGISRPGRRPRLIESNIRKAAQILSDGSRMPRADLVALQEADRGTLRAGGRDVARELAQTLGMNFVRAAAPTPGDAQPKDRKWWLDFEERIRVGEEGDTGVAMLSRFEISCAARVELPWDVCPWRPHLAITGALPFAGRRLHVFNSHIDTHANIEGQLRQHRAVLALADRVSEGNAVVLLGDFNTLNRPARDAARALLESRGYSTPMPTDTATWRSGPLRHHFDWIFVRGARVRRWGVARVTGISDHWPVWAELEAE